MFESSFSIPNPYVKKRPVRASLVGIRSDNKQYVATTKGTRQNAYFYVCEGEFFVEIDNSNFVAKPGDVFWLPEKQPYKLHSNPDLPWKYLFININDELTYSMLKAYKIKNTYHFPGFDDPALFEEFAKAAHKDCDADELIDNLTVIFLKIIQKMRRILDNITFKPSDTPALANFIKSFIDINVFHSFNLDDITKCTYCSKNHAIRVFKQTFGMTPYQYIIEKKTTIAKDLILESNYNIKQIADLLHFKSPNDFSTFFKRNTGMTPSQFKNANK